MIDKVPTYFYKYIIRGIFDAEGCISYKDIQYKSCNRKEFSISISTYENLLKFINKIFISENLTNTLYKLNQRHIDKDEYCKSLHITGNTVVEKIMDWIYTDEYELSLTRKYDKYKMLKEYKINYRNEK